MAIKELGYEYVECIRLDHLTDEERKAYTLAHNKTTMNSDFDFDILSQELEDLDQFFDMSNFGFEPLEPVEPEAEDDDFDIDEALDKAVEPKTKRGEIYQLGNHRLMCGDSTSEEDVKKLMNGEEADLVVTDPPYNVAIENSKGMTIENDNMESQKFQDFLTSAFKNLTNSLKPGGAFYVWFASREHINFETALNNADLTVRQELIWNKNALILGRQDYQWKHEPCLYGWKDGASHYFVDDRAQTTVFEDQLPNFSAMKKEELVNLLQELYSDRTSTTIINEKKPAVNDLHPTMKPIKLISRLVKNSSKQGEKVLDLFGGSGSTLITCEQLKRKCYTMEYDPQYADVIIDRWEQLTGKKAVKIN